jgi:hypothetical protein
MDNYKPLVTKEMLTNGWALVIESPVEKFRRIADKTRNYLLKRTKKNDGYTD